MGPSSSGSLTGDQRNEPSVKPSLGPGVIGVVVTGDNHLSPALPRLSPQRRADRRAWLRRGFEAAVNYAIAHDAALFINTGDLFDTPAPTNLDRAFVAAQLARLAQAGIVSVAIGGNHDTPRLLTEQGGEAPQSVYTALDGFHYFAASDLPRPHLYTVRGLRMAIAGLSNNPVARPGSNPLASAAEVSAGERDPEGALAACETALLVLHAAIEDLARPSEGERIVTRASLDALDPAYQTVVAGHIHRFARQRMGGREIVVVGATERMEFGPSAGAPGFVWMEVGAGGVRRVEHIRLEPQPRAEVSLNVRDLWPAGTATDSDTPLAVIRAALEPHAGEQTMARLLLTGQVTRDQYHQLALREIIVLGQQWFFSLSIDTSGLTITDPALTLPDLGADGPPRGLADMLRETLAEAVARGMAGAEDAPSAEDARAAGELLLARLRELDALEGLDSVHVNAPAQDDLSGEEAAR